MEALYLLCLRCTECSYLEVLMYTSWSVNTVSVNCLTDLERKSLD